MGILGAIIRVFKMIKKARKYRTMGKEALLALEDEEFYDAMECICEDAALGADALDNLNEAQRIVHSLIKFEVEVNNGGLCQFFVNSSRACAPFVSNGLEKVGAKELKALYDEFLAENKIDVCDLSSFEVSSYEEYEKQTERYDFDGFDDRFYEDEKLHQQIIDYARVHIEELI